MITALAAAKAYQAASKGVTNIGEPMPSLSTGATAGAGGFGEILKSTMNDVVKASHHAERQMAAQVAGKADLVDVVTAISAAEQSLETVMAVRDQVINAYQEIMRMPI